MTGCRVSSRWMLHLRDTAAAHLLVAAAMGVPVTPVDQIAAEALLQCLDATAQRWLAQADGFAGAGKALVLDQGNKVA